MTVHAAMVASTKKASPIIMTILSSGFSPPHEQHNLIAGYMPANGWIKRLRGKQGGRTCTC